MARQDELLKAVLADPDNDQPRVNYALFLDRTRDPRADFIRAELRLQSPQLSPVDRSALLTETHKMLLRYKAKWSASLTPFVQDCDFDRGFPEHVTLSAQDFLDHGQTLFDLAPIRHLDLNDIQPVVSPLFNSPHLQRIRSLSLNACGLGDDDVKELASSRHLPNLRWLSLADNSIGFDGADALAASGELKRLQFVNFSGNPVDPSEQYAHDQGIIMDTWLPEEGQRLENRHGPIPWLHLSGETIADAEISRY